MKVAIISDVHIGLRKNSEIYYKIVEEWSDWLIQELKEKEITTIYFLGDWFHYRDEISVKTLDFSTSILRKISSEFEIHMITGNHDCYLKENSEIHSLKMFDEWKNVFIYDKIHTMTHDKNTFVFCPWGTTTKDIPKGDVILGHFEIENFKMNKYYACKEGENSSKFLNKSALVFSGHFHMRQEKQYKKGKIIYVGSPYQHDFNDVDNSNGYYILDTNTLNYEFCENNISPKYQFIKSEKDIVTETVKNNFVKIKITKNDEKAVETLLNKVIGEQPLEYTIDSFSNKNIDISKKNINIDTIDVYSMIKEFISELEYDKESILLDKTKYYYEKCKS